MAELALVCKYGHSPVVAIADLLYIGMTGVNDNPLGILNFHTEVPDSTDTLSKGWAMTAEIMKLVFDAWKPLGRIQIVNESANNQDTVTIAERISFPPATYAGDVPIVSGENIFTIKVLASNLVNERIYTLRKIFGLMPKVLDFSFTEPDSQAYRKVNVSLHHLEWASRSVTGIAIAKVCSSWTVDVDWTDPYKDFEFSTASQPETLTRGDTVEIQDGLAKGQIVEILHVVPLPTGEISSPIDLVIDSLVPYEIYNFQVFTFRNWEENGKHHYAFGFPMGENIQPKGDVEVRTKIWVYAIDAKDDADLDPRITDELRGTVELAWNVSSWTMSVHDETITESFKPTSESVPLHDGDSLTICQDTTVWNNRKMRWRYQIVDVDYYDTAELFDYSRDFFVGSPGTSLSSSSLVNPTPHLPVYSGINRIAIDINHAQLEGTLHVEYDWRYIE